MRRADRLEHDVTARAPLGDLDLRRARAARNLPHEHHGQPAYPPAGCVNQQRPGPLTSTNTSRTQKSGSRGTSQEDTPTFTPEETFEVEPKPWFVSYQ